MLKRFNFFFSNEFQKFHIEAKVSEYDLIYKVHIAEGVLGVTTSNEWQIYSKDAVLWLKDFIDLRTFNWGESYSHTTLDDSDTSILPKWTLDIEEDDESALPTQHIVGLNSYPENFPYLLELIRKLLNLKFLILEV